MTHRSIRRDDAANDNLAETVYRDDGLRVYALAARMLADTGGAACVTHAVLICVLRRLQRSAGGPVSLGRVYEHTVRAVMAARRTAPGGRVACVPEVRGRLESAIARLPVGWRDVFVLSDVERLGGAEVGRLLGLCEDEVADRLHRARLTLLPAVRPVT